jgi:hypothetical protein
MSDDTFIQDAYLSWLTGRVSFSGPLDVSALEALRLDVRARKAITRLPQNTDNPGYLVTVRDLVEGKTFGRNGWRENLSWMKNFGAVGCRHVSEALVEYCGRPLHPIHFGEHV